MLTRLLAIAIAATPLLFTGCQMNPAKFLPPDKRDQTPAECPTDCYPQVDPYKTQWVSEYIRVNRNGVFHLWLPEGWEYDEPAITFKTTEAANALNCSEHASRNVRCKLTNSAQSNVKYGYTIHVRERNPGAPPSAAVGYDPFVWPR